MYGIELTEYENQLIIVDRLFHGNYAQREFIDNLDPGNRIRFDAFTIIKDGMAEIRFDRNKGSVTQRDLDDVYEIKLPKELLERPFSHDNARMRELNEIHTGMGFYLVDEDLRQRISGVLPTISLDGEIWTVDGYLNQLRNVKEPWLQLDGNYLYSYEKDDDAYLVVYDRKHKCDLSDRLEDLTDLSGDLIVLKFDMPALMDPIGYSRINKLPLMNVAFAGHKQHYTAVVMDDYMEKLRVLVNNNRLEAGSAALKIADCTKEKAKNKQKGKGI